MSPGSSDNQSSSPQPAQQKLKQQKKKASLTSKIPALPVEITGSADISGLSLQFGALQFGSEPVLSDYESTPTTSTSSSQAPNPSNKISIGLLQHPIFHTHYSADWGRDGSLASNPYSGDLTKFGLGDASSPAPATTLAQPQQDQTQTHHTMQQTFLNLALPSGYSYTSLPYYTGVPGLPSTFQYGLAVFPVAPISSKQHGVNVSVNASATPFQ
ncbi:hypothetical protein P7K49_010160 [Saguinus oedipus]|uniref:UBAP2 n=1 Tax=Saguinus oedipus TaxID=9490 RepID=A0ABQ9VM26_SAGOE|nr:hypothetical protein P7K49_010160 [Saguinus oedipus]